MVRFRVGGRCKRARGVCASRHPRAMGSLFDITYFFGTFLKEKLEFASAPPGDRTACSVSRFRGPIARFGANSFPGPVPLGRRELTARQAAEPTSRRAAERAANARKPNPPRPRRHAEHKGRSKRTQRNAMAMRRCVPPFIFSRRPLCIIRLAFAVATATQFCSL